MSDCGLSFRARDSVRRVVLSRAVFPSAELWSISNDLKMANVYDITLVLMYEQTAGNLFFPIAQNVGKSWKTWGTFLSYFSATKWSLQTAELHEGLPISGLGTGCLTCGIWCLESLLKAGNSAPHLFLTLLTVHCGKNWWTYETPRDGLLIVYFAARQQFLPVELPVPSTVSYDKKIINLWL